MNLDQHAAAIMRSLEVVAEHGDPAPAVYELLFAHNPEMKPLFWRDASGSVRGNMLATTLDILMDLVGTRHYARGMLQSEIVNHDGLGVPGRVFVTFFPTVRDAFKQIAGAEWTGEMDTAWDAALGEIEAIMRAAATTS